MNFTLFFVFLLFLVLVFCFYWVKTEVFSSKVVTEHIELVTERVQLVTFER